ncbi:MAG: TIM barrel protein [Bacteroidales bacterium]|nr:TIM barrel protein [Clostridium sp.]MCM1203007.1 TIM barrel protein [Bacteroidales bacterium]
MGRFMIVSKADRLADYKKIAKDYGVSFEINDFYYPTVLDDVQIQKRIVEQYQRAGIPENSTMHGAFFDIVPFSQDERIREASRFRMRQSMDIARLLGVKGIVFHTNCNPMLSSKEYDDNVIEQSVSYLGQLLEEYPGIQIYLENMFDAAPEILAGISDRLSVYDNYGVCLDYAHASIFGTSMDDWVESLSPYLKHIHINDNDLKRDLHLAVGAGKIDWSRFKQYYHGYFDRCSVLIETVLPEAQIQSLQFIKENIVDIIKE